MKKGTPVIVKWIDTVEDGSWMDAEKAEKYQPIECTTIGFFLNKDKKALRLFNTINKDGDLNIMVIPWAWKTKITKIKLEGF